MSNKLDNHSNIYSTEDGSINKDINSYNVVELIKIKNLIGGTAIQLGLGDGYVAEEMSKYYEKLLVVEGSQEVINNNYVSNKGYEIVCSYFEDFKPTSQVDYILGNHVLEHVDNPVEVLSKVKKWLKPGGRAIFTVPNATSLHRRIGVEMGMLKVLHEFNKQDIELGHQRVYNIFQFAEDIKSSGFKILETSGYMIKLVSNQQMKDWPKELLEAIFRVSLSAPTEICSNICIICEA